MLHQWDSDLTQTTCRNPWYVSLGLILVVVVIILFFIIAAVILYSKTAFSPGNIDISSPYSLPQYPARIPLVPTPDVFSKDVSQLALSLNTGSESLPVYLSMSDSTNDYTVYDVIYDVDQLDRRQWVRAVVFNPIKVTSASTVDYFDSGMVNSSVADQANRIYSDIRALIELDEAYQTTLLTGHGVGGNVASLIAARLNMDTPDTSIVTYISGVPRVGDLEICQSLSELNLWILQNSSDTVTSLTLNCQIQSVLQQRGYVQLPDR